jgi:hypothetical protein
MMDTAEKQRREKIKKIEERKTKEKIEERKDKG